MYSRFQFAKKYLHYYLTASSGRGHGVHSPFVFEFVTKVLRDKNKNDCFKTIESLRAKLLRNSTLIEVDDYGAGSSIISFNKKTVKSIAGSSLKNKKFAQLFYRIVQYYNLYNIVEIGTSFGITTSYLASANPLSKVYTLEGAKNIASIALDNFKKLGLKKVYLIEGNFDETLPELIKKMDKADLVFIDGNHRKIPTIKYFNWLLKNSHDKSVFIFDDIHWSAEMEDAWKQVQAHPSVTYTIDLFFAGIVFFNKDFKAKQHFTIRF